MAEHPGVPLWLVVVRGLGEKPMMPLTNLPLRKNRKVLWWVVSTYLTRWRVEEAIRFIKQSYHLEDIRVLTYERLRNMAVLVNAVAFFTAVVLGNRPETAFRSLRSHGLHYTVRARERCKPWNVTEVTDILISRCFC
jgi:hypothetical protein